LPLSTPGVIPSDWGAGAASRLLECVHKIGCGRSQRREHRESAGLRHRCRKLQCHDWHRRQPNRDTTSRKFREGCAKHLPFTPLHGHPLLGCSTARHRRCGSPRPLMPWLGLPTAGAPPSYFAAHDRTVTLPPSRRSPSVALKPPRRIQGARVWKRDVGQADDAPLFHRNADARPARPW
jgi:hypothetical protein